MTTLSSNSVRYSQATPSNVSVEGVVVIYHVRRSHGAFLIGVPENRTAESARPKSPSKCTRPSFPRACEVGSGHETTRREKARLILIMCATVTCIILQCG